MEGQYLLSDHGLDLEKGIEREFISLLTEENSILDDMPFFMANKADGHETEIETELADVQLGSLYKGIHPSKPGKGLITDVCGWLEGRAEVDVRFLKRMKDQKKYKMDQLRGHMGAMRNSAAEHFFYGARAADPKGFDGLHVRYPYRDMPNVIDAGGTGSTNTDIWFIVWGPRACHGIFPEGTKVGVEFENHPKEAKQDDTGGTYYVNADTWEWHLGLVVADWRTAVRIANIDVTNIYITDSTDADYIDFRTLTIKAQECVPTEMRSKGIWYVNSSISAALRIQQGYAQNTYMKIDEWKNSEQVLFLHGNPVRVCDGILSTLDRLDAMP